MEKRWENVKDKLEGADYDESERRVTDMRPKVKKCIEKLTQFLERFAEEEDLDEESDEEDLDEEFDEEEENDAVCEDLEEEFDEEEESSGGDDDEDAFGELDSDPDSDKDDSDVEGAGPLAEHLADPTPRTAEHLPNSMPPDTLPDPKPQTAEPLP